MTITVEFTDKSQIEELESYIQGLYEFIDLDKSVLPISISVVDDTATIYIMDSFARYIYSFLFDTFNLYLHKGPTTASRMEATAKKFRRGAEHILISNVILD